jgi:hypothetical protein
MMGRDARLEKIIVYVQLNQGCLTEEAFKGVRGISQGQGNQSRISKQERPKTLSI